MPELPEVETVKNGLTKFIIGKTIKSVLHDWEKSFPNAPNDVEQFLINATVKNIERRAKILMIHLSTSYSLLIHLKMTGQLVYVQQAAQQESGISKQKTANKIFPGVTSGHHVRWGAGHPSPSLVGLLPDKSTRVSFTFDDGSQLFFNDQRKFGWVKLIPTSEIPNIDFMKKLGPEPLSADFAAKEFIERIQKRPNGLIKAVLLDQSIIAGIGNIYADESLFAAGIYPSTRVKDIPLSKLEFLFQELQAVLLLSIEKGGSTDKNYVNVEGKKGSYLSFAQVFRKEKQPCPRCGTTIQKIRVAGRGTHICPTCQVMHT